jgi:hypothetical protein
VLTLLFKRIPQRLTGSIFDTIYILYIALLYLLNSNEIGTSLNSQIVKVVLKWRCYMGSRDFASREKKKPKKDSKKQTIISTSFDAPKPEVEVIKKGKKNKGTEE